jgi:hypothetical protein
MDRYSVQICRPIITLGFPMTFVLVFANLGYVDKAASLNQAGLELDCSDI